MEKHKRFISVITVLTIVFTMTFATLETSYGASYSGKYWLKVNTKCNVVTAYEKKNGKWKPVRAMLCSSGLNNATPRGTFYTGGKWNWGKLFYDVYGQYCTQITDDILFHSVYYMKKGKRSSQPTSEFNKLGKAASHGCVRLSTMDAKWVYDKCKVGTKVTIYKSSNPGPLGKPKANKAKKGKSYYWDPTDPNKSNPYFTMRKPEIKVSSKKALTVKVGSKYSLKSKVTAKDPNTFMSLTSRIKVSKVVKYNSSKKKYVKASFSTKKKGTYKVTYYVKDPYGRSASKTVKIKVVKDLGAPTIKGAKDKTVEIGYVNAVNGVTASQGDGSRTSAIVTYIKAPSNSSYKSYTYNQAKTYAFNKEGVYTVKYVVKNKYSPYRASSKVVKFNVVLGENNKAPSISAPTTADAYVGDPLDTSNVKVTHNSGDLTSRLTVKILDPSGNASILTFSEASSYIFQGQGKYTVTYSIKNEYLPYQVVSKTTTINVQDLPIEKPEVDGNKEL